jgi:glycosyltransferase involved in cell wall biosynthesis
MSPPAISVIVPAHNGAAFYRSAADSIELQQCTELEIIVVDDGSIDGLENIVRNRTPAARYVRQEQRGPAAARNTALRQASSDLIAFLDIDDIWAEGHLARLCEALQQHPDAGFAQGLVRQFVVLPDGGRLLSGTYRMPYLGACLFRRSVFRQCGGFDEEMQMGEDYDLIVRCWEHDIPKQDVGEVSLLYRRHQGNMTRGKNRSSNLAVLQRRMRRIRAGATNPAAPRRFVFESYIGEIRNFAETQVEMPGQWNPSSAS